MHHAGINKQCGFFITLAFHRRREMFFEDKINKAPHLSTYVPIYTMQTKHRIDPLKKIAVTWTHIFTLILITKSPFPYPTARPGGDTLTRFSHSAARLYIRAEFRRFITPRGGGSRGEGGGRGRKMEGEVSPKWNHSEIRACVSWFFFVRN